jgi:hypothetical protein
LVIRVRMVCLGVLGEALVALGKFYETVSEYSFGLLNAP